DELKARLAGERCPCGNVHRLSPVEVILGEGALESSARTLLRNHGAGASLWVLSDERTEAAAGERWKRGTRTASITSRILPGDPPAKYFASIDWQLAARITGETYCEVLAGFALQSARRAIDSSRAWESDPEAALTALAEAALVSGFAMQAFGTSRPAASAEHTVAHFWETVGAAGAPEHDLHGILVGAATKLLLPGYTAWFGGAGG